MSARRRIWGNGAEFSIWGANNCQRCVKANPRGAAAQCDLLVSIWDAYFGDGTFAPEIVERLGYAGTQKFWCRELQTEGPVLPPPAAHEMTKAGASCLPGFDEDTGHAV